MRWFIHCVQSLIFGKLRLFCWYSERICSFYFVSHNTFEIQIILFYSWEEKNLLSFYQNLLWNFGFVWCITIIIRPQSGPQCIHTQLVALILKCFKSLISLSESPKSVCLQECSVIFDGRIKCGNLCTITWDILNLRQNTKFAIVSTTPRSHVEKRRFVLSCTTPLRSRTPHVNPPTTAILPTELYGPSDIGPIRIFIFHLPQAVA